jgi:uncharacterized damage-inducible protein DinB
VSVRAFYADWAGYNRRTIEGLHRLTDADLALQVHAVRDEGGPWPIWAAVGHTAATRVFWLCDVFGEPGGEGTPFGGDKPWWEDDLSHPRTTDELVWAWESTWSVIEGCLASWTPDSLAQEARREGPGDAIYVHTRQSILMRMITHEGYHLGEINLTLGANGREPIDPWPRSDWREGAPRSLREGSPQRL